MLHVEDLEVVKEQQPLKNGDGAWYIGTFSQAAKALTKWEKSIQADSMGKG